MKNVLFIVFAFLFGTHLRAQTANFAPLGAEWWYKGVEYAQSSAPKLLIRIKSVSDTVIQSQTCHKLVRTAYRRFSNQSDVIDTTALTNIYLYSQNDSIFAYNSFFNKFTLLFTFNVNTGDTLCLPVIGAQDLRPNPITGDTSFCVIIDSVKVEQYGTSAFKTVYTNGIIIGNSVNGSEFPSLNWPYGANFASYFAQGKFIEKLGGMYGLYPDLIHAYSSYGPFAELVCYRDPDFSYNYSSGCDSIPQFLSISGYGKNKFKLYPNPTVDFIRIENDFILPQNSTITISDLADRPVLPVQNIGGKNIVSVDLRNLPSGVYLVQVRSNGDYYRNKIVVAR